MKLRLRNNSVRLRLTRGEVEKLVETGLVEETVDFLPNPLVYLLLSSKEIEDLQANFHGGWLTVSVPQEMAAGWAGSEDVSMSAVYRGISILVEKDWACEHGSPDENEDTFPPPVAGE